MPVDKDDELHIGVDIGKASDDKTALMIQVGQKAYHFTGEEADVILQLIHAREEAAAKARTVEKFKELEQIMNHYDYSGTSNTDFRKRVEQFVFNETNPFQSQLKENKEEV